MVKKSDSDDNSKGDANLTLKIGDPCPCSDSQDNETLGINGTNGTNSKNSTDGDNSTSDGNETKDGNATIDANGTNATNETYGVWDGSKCNCM